MALLDKATTELVRFDTEAQSLGAARAGMPGNPPPTILLQADSASSSQIEQLTTTARQLFLWEIDETPGFNAEIIGRNVDCMRKALEVTDSISIESILAIHKVLIGEPDASLGRSISQHIGGRLREELV